MQMRNYNNRNSRNNNELYGNSSSSNSGGFNSKARGEQFRNRAIDGIDRLNETDDLMKNSMRLVNDSKELGVSTLVKVDEQTEILANTKQNVDETLVMSNSAGSILNSMAYRYCANKALLWVIIVVLIVANAIKSIPIKLEINTGDHAADIGEIEPFTPSELKVKLKI